MRQITKFIDRLFFARIARINKKKETVGIYRIPKEIVDQFRDKQETISEMIDELNKKLNIDEPTDLEKEQKIRDRLQKLELMLFRMREIDKLLRIEHDTNEPKLSVIL
ncbi:MAG: hypothetical protein WC333_02270 [Dehalococcoidia bacterium]|jgi:predicted DNA binding CopG/RHH family protein